MNSTCGELLGENGPLAAAIEGYAVRPGQQEMADYVADAIASRSQLVCEAGTGVGKTFAYLVPALRCGHRVIISTGTKTLQEQLFHRDLPVVRDALKVPVTVALLKGRANYLCIDRLRRAVADGGFSRDLQSALLRVQSWALRTRSGDSAEVSDVAEDSPVWPLVTSTADNCLGGECQHYQDCWVVKARREAQAAEIVVVNHHLFLADAALKDAGFGDVLPGADAVVFDEAHQLPETAAQFFGSSVSSRQLAELSRDAIGAQVLEAGDTPAVRDSASLLEKAIRDLRLVLGSGDERAEWSVMREQEPVQVAIAQLSAQLRALQSQLEAIAQRGPLLTNAHKRCSALLQQLTLFHVRQGEEYVQWFETHQRGFTLHQTPLDVAPLFQQHVASQSGALIFTSATLAVQDDFSYFSRQLGVESATTRRFDSPFDYSRQALLYLPGIDVDPRDVDYTQSVVEAALPVLAASRGHAFMLFTSHRALREASDRLRRCLEYPLLIQGEQPRAELLERFRHTPNAVLLGSASFWEGVDVRGEALSCVIIDKLPFSAPDDPMVQARIRALASRSANPFLEYQMPEAIIALKQGAGRLIRDVNDRGVLVLCDPRLRSKGYGRAFLRALPRMSVTTELKEVENFLVAESVVPNAALT